MSSLWTLNVLMSCVDDAHRSAHIATYTCGHYLVSMMPTKVHISSPTHTAIILCRWCPPKCTYRHLHILPFSCVDDAHCSAHIAICTCCHYLLSMMPAEVHISPSTHAAIILCRWWPLKCTYRHLHILPITQMMPKCIGVDDAKYGGCTQPHVVELGTTQNGSKGFGSLFGKNSIVLTACIIKVATSTEEFAISSLRLWATPIYALHGRAEQKRT